MGLDAGLGPELDRFAVFFIPDGFGGGPVGFTVVHIHTGLHFVHNVDPRAITAFRQKIHPSGVYGT